MDRMGWIRWHGLAWMDESGILIKSAVAPGPTRYLVIELSSALDEEPLVDNAFLTVMDSRIHSAQLFALRR